ncbi:MAG: ABC transporter substrate-binding protein [Candidatus Bipolaricaulota bacterium]
MRSRKLSCFDRLTRRAFLKALGTGALSVALGKATVYGQEPLTIGLQADLTGGLATYGYWHLKSARAAVEKINREGGIGGRRVKLVYEDTKTDPATGTRKMEKLILKEGADFVIGSQHSGVCLASLPVSRRFEVPYFPIGEATQITGSEGHKYVIRINYSVKAHARSGYRWVMENLGTNWTIVYADYAMGQSALKEWSFGLKAGGGNLIGKIPVPQGTDDFGPYLRKVNHDRTDVLFIVMYGPDALACVRRTHEMGLHKHMNRFGNTGSVEALNVEFPGAEGLWSITNYPRRAKQVPEDLKEYDVYLREKIGLTEEGKDPETGKIVDASHFWVPWEIIHFIRKASEKAGISQNQDPSRFIKFLEGLRVAASREYPQGEKYIRADDHQGFHSQYIQQVVDGKLVVEQKLPPEAGEYEPT